MKRPNLRFYPKKCLQVALMVFFLLGTRPVMAQDRMSKQDAKQIDYTAIALIEDDLPRLLNYITFKNDLQYVNSELISNSCRPSKDQIFVRPDAIIEDDIDPAYTLGVTKDAPVEKYLGFLDTDYEKTEDASIFFSEVHTSHVKKNKDNIYVKVRFDESFGSKHKVTGKTYAKRQREALVYMENQGGSKWKALIASIAYYDPTASTASPENDIPIVTDESTTAVLVVDEDFVKEKQNFTSAKRQEDKRKELVFNDYVAGGSSYLMTKRYDDALKMFLQAKEIISLVPSLDKKILDTRNKISENSYETLKNKADQAKGERRYVDALQYYKRALEIKPEEHITIENEIISISRKLDLISRPSNKLESGDFQGAINLCDEILKDNKKLKDDFPEIYYIKGIAYQRLAEKLPSDPKYLDRALENYKKAVDYFTNYTDARLARAAFYVKFKHDYSNAITDYDQITNNSLNDSPDKAKYLVVKGHWKDLQNSYDGAIDDFTKASNLDPGLVSAYIEKAELLYRRKRYEEALKNFNTAVKLDTKSSRGYYSRGLNYIGLSEAASAGIDFSQAEILGLEAYQVKNIESISATFFESGLKAFKLRDFKSADSLFDNAIAVRKCNARAWHGKGEINFTVGEESLLKAKNSSYQSSFQQAIIMYKKAVECDPLYSDAQYKIGQSYRQLGEYDLALKSFAQAIKSDVNSAQAYAGHGFTNLILKKYTQAISDYSAAARLLEAGVQAAKKSDKKALAATLAGDLSQAHQFVGEGWYYNKNLTQALGSISKALESNPKNAEAFYYQGLAYEALNDPTKAVRSYAEAIKYQPDFRYYHANGMALFKLHKYDQAVINFNLVIKADTLPEIKNAYYLRGLSYFKNKMLDNAYQDFSLYAKNDASKKDTLFYADFGWLNLYQNHADIALDNFGQALSLKKDCSQALYGMGCAYAKTGQFDKAIESIDKAFQTRQLKKDDVKLQEENFLAALLKNKSYKSKYNQLKKTYLPNS